MTNLAVTVTADVVDLQAKLAVAQANMRGFNAELRNAANEARAAGGNIGDALKTQLDKAAEGAIAARRQVASLEEQLGTAGVKVNGIREITAAMHELASGNMGALPGTFALLAHNIGELGLAGVTATAGIAALGAGLVELILHMKAAAEAAESARAAFAFSGIAESAAQVNAWVAQVAAMPGVSQAAASAYVQAFGGIRYGTDALKTELLDLVPILQQKFGTDGPKQAEKLAAAFNDLKGKGAATLESFGAAAPVMARFYAALNGGDQAAAFQILLEQMVARLQDTDKAFDKSALTAKSWWQELMLGLGGAEGGAEQIQKAIESIDTSKLKQIADDLKAAQTQAATQPQAMSSDAAFKAQLDALKNDTERSNQAILSDEIAAYAAREAEARKFGQDTAALESQRLALVAEAARAASSEAVAMARNQAAAIGAETGLGAVQKLAAERQIWAQLLAGDKLTYAERLNVQKSYSDASAALDRARQAETSAIAKSDADTDLAIGRLQLDAKKSLLAAEFSAKQITAQQEFEQLRQLAIQEEALDEQRLQAELAGLVSQPARHEEVYNQIRVLKAKLTADLAAMDKQEQLDALKSDKDQVSAWKGAVDEMTSAEAGLVRNVFAGRMSLTQELMQLSSQLVQKEIADDLKYYTTKLLYNALGIGSDKAMEQGGVLAHALAETQKTVATRTNVAAREAASTTESTSFLARLPTMIAQWLGLETADTAATTAGTATRTAAQTAAAAAGRAVAVSTGFSQISIDAAVAAAGTMAAISAIPYVGPFMAPPMAAEAYALTIGFAAGMGGGLISAEGGMLTVPADGTMIAAHAEESVLPASIANPMRDFFAGGSQTSSGQAGGDSYAITIQALDTQTGVQFLRNNIGTIVKSLQQQMRNGMQLSSLAPA